MLGKYGLGQRKVNALKWREVKTQKQIETKTSVLSIALGMIRPEFGRKKKGGTREKQTRACNIGGRKTKKNSLGGR